MKEIQHGLKPKTIKGILRRKFDDLLASIDDEHVRELVAANGIITGGSIASMLLGEKVNDYDIYFADKATTEAVAHYYVARFMKNPPPRFKGGTQQEIPVKVVVEDDAEESYEAHERDEATGEWIPVQKTRIVPGRVRIFIKSVGVAHEDGDGGNYQYFEGDPDPEGAAVQEYAEQVMKVAQDKADTEEGDDKPRYRPVFLTSNAITLSDGVQLIVRFYGNPDEIHENYDFVHCTNYWVAGENKLVLRPAALECLLSRELRYQGSRYPICSMFRLRKFIERGWSVNAGQILKMAMQISKLDLEDIEVLEDQLIGVDAAYFMQIVEILREKFPDGNCPPAYLLELLDRMF